MSAESTRVLRFHENGEPLDVLLEDMVEVADPPAGSIRVRVIATGLNPADWALTTAREPLAPWPGRVTAFDWGGLPLLFLPGEIFAVTALAIRRALPRGPTPFIISLSDGVPGYIPDRVSYPAGGYEVAEAHRYYGLPAGFAPGSAEALADAVLTTTRTLF